MAMTAVLYYAGAELNSWMVWCAGGIALVLEHLAWSQGVAHGVVMVVEMTDVDRKKLQEVLKELDHDIREQ
jgi:hypothetical protein